MTDIMVDVETTGTDPETASIIQLSAVKFNLETFDVGGHFDRCPSRLPRRSWDDGTKEFWSKNREVYDNIIRRQEYGPDVFLDFHSWVSSDAPEGGYRFWSKPLKFDWPIVESHMIQLGLTMPFPHWLGFDVHSYISGLRGVVGRSDIEKTVPFEGHKHNALHDCGYQIDLLFNAKQNHVHAEVIG